MIILVATVAVAVTRRRVLFTGITATSHFPHWTIRITTTHAVISCVHKVHHELFYRDFHVPMSELRMVGHDVCTFRDGVLTFNQTSLKGEDRIHDRHLDESVVGALSKKSPPVCLDGYTKIDVSGMDVVHVTLDVGP
jgi:hypothetical protein